MENHTFLTCKSKLINQELEFIPTSKTNASMTVLGNSSNLSSAKVNLDNRDFFPYLGCDISDEDDEDDMFDICFHKVDKDGYLSPTQPKNGSTKRRKKTY